MYRSLIKVAADHNCDDMWKTVTGTLARVILLDQFSRCVYRGTKQAFENDELAAGLVKKIVDDDCLVSEYAPIHRFFLGVAIQHSEDLNMQKIGLHIATQVAIDASDDIKEFFASLKGYPDEHHDVIERFHRFPSRNLALVSLKRPFM